jgi:hypothetical protein
VDNVQMAKFTVDLKNKIDESAYWIAVILGGGYWQAFVNKMINSRVPKKGCSILNEHSDYHVDIFGLLGRCAAYVRS